MDTRKPNEFNEVNEGGTNEKNIEKEGTLYVCYSIPGKVISMPSDDLKKLETFATNFFNEFLGVNPKTINIIELSMPKVLFEEKFQSRTHPQMKACYPKEKDVEEFVELNKKYQVESLQEMAAKVLAKNQIFFTQEKATSVARDQFHEAKKNLKKT